MGEPDETQATASGYGKTTVLREHMEERFEEADDEPELEFYDPKGDGSIDTERIG
jgi:hypothetical protein